MVLPNGIFSSQSYQFRKLRDIIWSKTEIVAIVGLPHWVFFHTGCDVQGSLLFLKRTDTLRADYNVFIDWADNVGYDAAGKKTGKNDFPGILERFAAKDKKHFFKASYLKTRGRIDPLYYQPGEHQKAGVVKGKNMPLTDLLIESTERIIKKRDNKSVVKYVEVGDTDKITGKIISTATFAINELPSRAQYIARENMLLIPNHRNSIKAKRSVVLVPQEYDGVVVTSRFIAVRTKVPATYLYQVLNLDFVKEKMRRLVSGSSSTEVKFDQLSKILVPMPEGEDFDLFLDDLHTLQDEVSAARLLLKEKENGLSNMMRKLYGP